MRLIFPENGKVSEECLDCGSELVGVAFFNGVDGICDESSVVGAKGDYDQDSELVIEFVLAILCCFTDQVTKQICAHLNVE